MLNSFAIVWSLVEGSLLGAMLAVLVISMFAATEAISHLFARYVSDKTQLTASGERMYCQVFQHFHMRSFLIYWLALYVGAAIALVVNVWLVLIRVSDLNRERLARAYRDDGISVKVNDNFLSKFTVYRLRGGQR